MLVHRVAVKEIANDQAIHQLKLGEYGRQGAGFVHRRERLVGMRQLEDFRYLGPQGILGERALPDLLKCIFDPPFGLHRQRNPVSRDELKQQQGQRRLFP